MTSRHNFGEYVLRYSNKTELDYIERLSVLHKMPGMGLDNDQWHTLYELRMAVARYGGFERVCKPKAWAKFWRELGYSGRIDPSLLASVKNSYQTWIRPYEEYLNIAKPGVSAETSAEHSDSARSLRRQSFARDDVWTNRPPVENHLENLDAFFPYLGPGSDHPEGLQDEVELKSIDISNEDLSHPIGTSYMPNAQLVYSSDEKSESEIAEVELPDRYARLSHYSESGDESSNDLGAFALSAVNSNPPIHPLGSNGVFNVESYGSAMPSLLRDEYMLDSPQPDSSMLQQIAASFEKQSF